MSAFSCPDQPRPIWRGRRLWLAATVAALTLALAAPAFAKHGDSVVGSGSAGFGTFSVNAVGGKKPSKPAKGTLVFHLAIGDIVGQATCVDVQGGLGVVSGRLVAGTTAVDTTFTQGFNLYVADGSVTVPGSTSCNCSWWGPCQLAARPNSLSVLPASPPGTSC